LVIDCLFADEAKGELINVRCKCPESPSVKNVGLE
jgi:hypothetical protein